jgi:peroxiredoxin family protein
MKKKNVDSLQTLMTNANSLGIKIIACASEQRYYGNQKRRIT